MTRKQPKEQRVSEILDAAISEFIEKGYEGTSMESIALRAGITKGGVYYHFSSKDEILLRANDAFMEPVIGFMSEASQSPSAVKGLASYIRKYLAYWSARPREMTFVFLSLTKTFSNPELMKGYAEYAHQMAGFFEGLYEKGLASGEFARMHPRRAAAPLMAALDGIVAYIAIDGGFDLKETAESFIETFINRYRLGQQ